MSLAQRLQALLFPIHTRPAKQKSFIEQFLIPGNGRHLVSTVPGRDSVAHSAVELSRGHFKLGNSSSNIIQPLQICSFYYYTPMTMLMVMVSRNLEIISEVHDKSVKIA